MPKGYDFSGWATKYGTNCIDGLTIKKGAFTHMDGRTVPLVYNHQHNDISQFLGHAVLEARDEGIYAYGYLNDTPQGNAAKKILKHGDADSLSIWANNLDKRAREVMHGVIREVSLVLAGANPGAMIESVVAHGMSIDEDEDEGIIYSGEGISLEHSIKMEGENMYEDENLEDELYHGDDDGLTVGDVYDDMTDVQKEAVAALVGMAVESALAEGDGDDEDDEDYDEGDDEMSHNVFENNGRVAQQDYISHSDVQEIMKNAKACNSFKVALHEYIADKFGDDAVLMHSAMVPTQGMTLPTGNSTYGFNDPDFFFGEYRSINGNTPEWISRNMDWVNEVLSDVHRTPFAKVKMQFADITEDEARARGYIKGKQKKEEVFSVLKRTIDATTIYKKQKMDRDDIIDIVDFEPLAWIRAEMRVALNEEIARAILIGDGRPADSEDKIKEDRIIPVIKDVPLFNVVVKVPEGATPMETAENIIDMAIRARKNYKGSGSPKFWTTEDYLTEMLLIKDKINHKIYKSEAEVATAIRAKKITTVEPMEGQKVSLTENGKVTEYPLIGVFVNLIDYNVGTNKGGEINFFDDFDIDYNQQKYLLETRMSGALTKPFSALTFVLDESKSATPSTPSTPPTGGDD